MKDELEKLGYKKSENKNSDLLKNYVEYENAVENVRISYDASSDTVYIRQMTNVRPVVVTTKEMMALLVSIGKAEIVK